MIATGTLTAMGRSSGRGLIAAVVATAVVSLGAVAAAQSDSTRRPRRWRWPEAGAGRRLRRTGLRRRRPRRAEAAVRGRAAGLDPGLREGKTAGRALPRHPRPGPATAARRACSRSPSTRATRRTGRFYVYFVNRGGNIEVDAFRRKKHDTTRADLQSRRKVIEIAHPATRTTTAASSSSAPTACSTSAPATAAAAATPTPTPRTRTVLLGKLLRIDPRKGGGYATPGSNPFSGGNGKDEIYALGLRNPYRFSFDRKTGDIFIGDVGQDALRGDRPRGPAAGSRRELRLGHLRGQPRLRGRRSAGELPRRRCSSISSRGGNCAVTGGYVVRDPRAAGARRPLRLRRLLRRRAALLRSLQPGAKRFRHRARAQRAELVRRGRRAAASTSPRSPAASSGSPRSSAWVGAQRGRSSLRCSPARAI